MSRPLTNSTQIVEELDALNSKVDKLIEASKGVSLEYTAEELAFAKKMGIELPPKTGTVELKSTYDWGKASFILLCAWIVLMFVFALPMKGCGGGGDDKPKPSPTPVANKIIVDTQAEYDVILSAFERVAQEWTLSQYDSVAAARQALDWNMGGPVDGVKQSVQEQILAYFKDDSDFLGTLETVKKKYNFDS